MIENEEQRSLMVERLLDDPEDVLHFDEKTHATGTGTSITETNKSITEHYWL